MGSDRFSVVGVGILCLTLAPALGAAAPAADPPGPSEAMRAALALTARIDHHVAAQWTDKGVKPAPPSSDAEFLRRVYLDLAGRIPRVNEVHDFLNDKSPDKRLRLIDRLVEDPENENLYYRNHFTSVWRALMVPQSNNVQLQGLAFGLDNWLRSRLRDNVAYDQMVREILTAPVGINPGQGGRPVGNPGQPTPLAFYQANEYKPENLAAATSRLFLGVKLECAQCHDHPFAKLSRDQFWEYAAFFAGIQTRGRGGAFGQPVDTANQRELTIPGTEKKVQARFLDGKEPEWKEGVSTRATLAAWMTAADNPYFAKAAANRLWAQLIGQGLTDPVDEPSDDNPPSHPELLDELAKEFAARQFDLKFLIRAITASKAYQLTSAQTDPSQADPRLLARMNLKGLTPEQLFDSLAAATGYREAANPNQRGGFFGINTPRGEFLAKFANHSDKRTEYTTSILQALSLMNGRFIADATHIDGAPNLWRSETLAGVADAPFLDTPKKLEALYLAALARKPRPDELERLVPYVDKGGPSGDSKRALADVFWVLLNSSEFILNH